MPTLTMLFRILAPTLPAVASLFASGCGAEPLRSQSLPVRQGSLPSNLVIPEPPKMCDDALLQDALEASEKALLRAPVDGSRLLFVPPSDECCVTGGERNFALLTLATSYFHFDVHTLIKPGSCADMLKSARVHPVSLSSGDETLPPTTFSLPALKPLHDALHAWYADKGGPAHAERILDLVRDLSKTDSRSVASEEVMGSDYRRTELVAGSILRLMPAVQAIHPDVIITDLPWDAVAALAVADGTPIRVLSYVQNADQDQSDDLIERQAEIVAASARAAERFGPRARLSLVRNGVNVRRFAPDASLSPQLRGLMGVSPTAFVIGHSGYIDRNKNQLAVLRAAILAKDHIRDMHVVFLGVAPQPAYLHALTQEAAAAHIEDRVHYLGHRNDLAHLLPQMDLFVFPSRQEGFGLSLAEAMSSGVVAVANPLSAYDDFSCDGLEKLNVDDARVFADAMIRVSAEGESRRLRGLTGRAQILEAQLTTDRMIGEFAVALGAAPTGELPAVSFSPDLRQP